MPLINPLNLLIMKKTLNILNLGFNEYSKTLGLQRKLMKLRQKGSIEDLLILVEHNHVYTLGRSGKESNLLLDKESLRKKGIEFWEIERGGDITYHGPGQIVGYPIFDLTNIKKDVHHFLRNIEEVLIRVLKEYGIDGKRIKGKTGVWVRGEKIASIGVKISRWITWHGFAMNVNTDLSYFDDIILCGLKDAKPTSMERLLGKELDMEEVEKKIVNYSVVIFDYSNIKKQKLKDLIS